MVLPGVRWGMTWEYKDAPGVAQCMDHLQREAPVTVPLVTTPPCSPASFWQPEGADLGPGVGGINKWVALALGLGGMVEVEAGGCCGLR